MLNKVVNILTKDIYFKCSRLTNFYITTIGCLMLAGLGYGSRLMDRCLGAGAMICGYSGGPHYV